MKQPELKKVTVSKLRQDLLARRFAIPKLQRNFVWDSGRAAKLLDSMYYNMPIGSFFLWEMDKASAKLVRQSTDVLPSFNDANKDIWFVIDGQQRLSVIHQAFEAQVRKNDAARTIDFGRLCFVVEPDGTEESPARVVYRKPVDRQYIPLRDILAPDWKSRMRFQPKTVLKRVDYCRQQLLKYPVPMVVVRSASMNEIGEVFIRVNSQGMRITSADRAIALMGSLDLREMANELRQRVRDEVFALGGVDPILMGFNFVAEPRDRNGDPPKLDAMARRWSKRIERDKDAKARFKKLWQQYQKAFTAAVDYLHHRFPVHDESYLPSANMLATLSVFFFHHPGQPDAYQAKEIRKWFWATGVAQRYTGKGYHLNLVADADLFESLAQGKKKRFVFRELLDPVIDIQGSEYASRSARTRSFFCLLATRKPLYLETGETIPLGLSITSHANAMHRHHIFPKAQLAKHFSSRVYNSLCNICFLVARDNTKIGMRLPRNYLAQYDSAGKRQLHRVMKSHLIPVRADSGVWDEGVVRAFKEFRRNRLELICTEFEKQAGIRLFRKGQ